MTEQNLPIPPASDPIICSSYDEPNKHWVYDSATGEPSFADSRRPAGYWYKTERSGLAQMELFPEEERDDLPIVNLLRQEVKRWREVEYRGATKVTQDLLRHWLNPNRLRRLFFCQREAVETIIYLAEIRIPGRSSVTRFQKFALTEENLGLLLEGEAPKLHLAKPELHPTLVDKPFNPDFRALRRLGCKMATGSGKTVVMSMLIAWAFCNRGTTPASRGFPNAVLICAPNLTVKERLQVLRPDRPDNYYTEFDIVPRKYRHFLQQGKVLVENWHQFLHESEHKEGDKSYAVVDKGPETPETLARRVLGDLFERMPIMVLNDEGHHCWRPAPGVDPDEILGKYKTSGRKAEVTNDEKEDLKELAQEARVWLRGLDFINNALGKEKPGIALCVDLSATPFYIRGSGYPEGLPFPWLVSDFGLVDAIESGIVKVPRLPVKDTSEKKDEAGRPDPKYFRLWHNIVGSLKASEKLNSGKPKAEVAYREAEGALKQIAGQWVERFKYFEEANEKQDQALTPPVLIVVCDNIDIADEFYRKLSGETEVDEVTPEDVEDVEAEKSGKKKKKKSKSKTKKITAYGPGTIFPEYFSNTKERQFTIRIDSHKVEEDPNIREIVSTVGRKGKPGEHIRCVVSVSMLTEGWDANNVTHILGIRAFGSQLLCEQVVGRGLRRMSYEPDPETGFFPPEYVDVYGIPFSVIPFKGRAVNQKAPEDKPQHRVWSVPDREEFELRFPVVEGYVYDFKKNIIKCNLNDLEPITIDSKLEPVTSWLRPAAGYVDIHSTPEHPFEFVQHDRETYYGETHSQTILFQITQRIIDELLSPLSSSDDKKTRVLKLQSRHHLFPQVFAVVQAFVNAKVDFNGVDHRELGLEKYTRLVVERIRDGITPDDSAGEPPLLPILNRYRPWNSTDGVDFPTKRPVTKTKRSHINLVVQHSDWEGEAAKILDKSKVVKAYARNDHLGLTVPYEYLGAERDYEPDFLVQLVNDLMVLLEIKGYEIHGKEQINAKHTAARKWATAVNNLGEFGEWEFVVCRELAKLEESLTELFKK
ncbi:MAG: BPTD_3080 family restriction endonuclease [Gemmataceae bacterium]